jgi:hypothetical protein
MCSETDEMAFVESFSKILEMLKMFFKECKMNED